MLFRSLLLAVAAAALVASRVLAEPVARVASKLLDDTFSLQIDTSDAFVALSGPYRPYGDDGSGGAGARNARAMSRDAPTTTPTVDIGEPAESSESMFFVAWGYFVALDLLDNEIIDASPLYVHEGVMRRPTGADASEDACAAPCPHASILLLLANEHALYEALVARAVPASSQHERFEEARAWIVALVQHISVHEYATAALGHVAAAAASGPGIGRYGHADDGTRVRDAEQARAARALSPAFARSAARLEQIAITSIAAALAPTNSSGARAAPTKASLYTMLVDMCSSPLRALDVGGSAAMPAQQRIRLALAPACVRGGLFGTQSEDVRALDDQLRRARIGDRFWYEWYLGAHDRRTVERESVDMLVERALYGTWRRTRATPLVEFEIGSSFCVRGYNARSAAGNESGGGIGIAGRQLRGSLAAAPLRAPAVVGAATIHILLPPLPHVVFFPITAALAIIVISLFVAMWFSETWRREMHTDANVDVDERALLPSGTLVEKRCERCVDIAREGVLK